LCHNFIQFVQQWNNITLFCGTDSARQTCYIVENSNKPQKKFSANRLVGFEPNDATLMEISRRQNDLKIISAAPKNLNKDFGVYLSEVSVDNDSEIKLVRQTADATFRYPTEFLVSFTVDDHVVFMGRELIGRNWKGFMYHVCKNDPGRVKNTYPRKNFENEIFSSNHTCCIKIEILATNLNLKKYIEISPKKKFWIKIT